jgi:peptide chain release factor 1
LPQRGGLSPAAVPLRAGGAAEVLTRAMGMIQMIETLEKMKSRYEELTELVGRREILNSPNKLKEITKEMSRLSPLVKAYAEYKKLALGIADAEEIVRTSSDGDLVDLAKSELQELRPKWDDVSRRLKEMLVPKDPRDEKSAIVEIRAGTGGEEAALFAADIYRMYTMYAENMGWSVDVMNTSPSDAGGFKEITFHLQGDGVYGRMKFESGVHRVQRVPTTEASGRIHTSAVTVAVLPEAEEVDVDIDPKDLEVDVFRSSGPGGQSVNTADSAVRIKHVPTGLVVQCQDERSQLKNKNKAMKVLRARLLELQRREQEEQVAAQRRSQVSTGDRSAKIRTYNFPQGRVTDHRIGLTLYRLSEIMDGDLNELTEAMAAAENEQKLKAS